MPGHTMMKTHKMPDGSMMKGSKHKGLSPKQKANLPAALQKAILKKMTKPKSKPMGIKKMMVK